MENTIAKSIKYAPIRGIENHVLERNGKLTSPLTLFLEITNVCNQDCLFCVQPIKWQIESFKPYHISLKRVEALLHEAKMLGVLEFHISGGEPTCHPQFIEIAELIKKFEFAVSIITNGINLSPVDIKKLTRILDPEQDLFVLGLDAADPATYKKLRGKDHFDSLCATLRMMREAALPFATQAVIVKDNIASLEDIWEISAMYGSKAHILILPYRTKDAGEDIYPSDEEIRLCLTHLYNHMKCHDTNSTPLILPGDPSKEHGTATHRNCLAGHTSFALNACGEIHVCAFALDNGFSVGNIDHTSLFDGWEKIRQFMERTGGADSMLHGHHCPVKAGLSQYDLTKA